MNIEDYREYCLSLPLVEESMPFDDNTLVYKIGGKMFSLARIMSFDRFAVKCDPDMALDLRDKHEEVCGAYHLNKKHWNDIFVTGRLSKEFMQEQIFNSYLLVVNKSISPKTLRNEILFTMSNHLKNI